jgi:hypothetical protein
VLAAAGFAGYYAARSVTWAVMTDELQVARLATSIADTLSPVPQVHGVYYGALSQLYPLLLAPLIGVLDAPTDCGARRSRPQRAAPTECSGACVPPRSLGERVARCRIRRSRTDRVHTLARSGCCGDPSQVNSSSCRRRKRASTCMQRR